MPEYKTPGVYREERSGPRPIEGVGTAVAAFIGFAPAGPANKPVLITSWQQYVEKFGKNEGGRRNPHLPGAYLSHAVEGYFRNGGGRCYVTRVLPPGAGNTATPQVMIPGQAGQPLLTFSARSTPGNDIEIAVKPRQVPAPAPPPAPPPAVAYEPGRYTLKIRPLDENENVIQDQKREQDDFTQPKSLETINKSSTHINITVAPGFDKLAPEQREPLIGPVRTTTKGEATIFSAAATGKPLYIVSLKDPTGNRVEVEVVQMKAPVAAPAVAAPPPPANPSTAVVPADPRFDIEISSAGSIDSKIENVGFGPRNNVVEAVRRCSKLVTVTVERAVDPQVGLNELPVAGMYTIAAPNLIEVQVEVDHFKGDRREQSGIEGLAIAEEATMICCPDLMAAHQQGWLDPLQVKAVQLAMIAHCEDPFRRDRIAILDPLPGQDVQEVLEWRTQIANYDSPFAAFYYPWIKIDGPDGKIIEVPPSGHIAGIYARNDRLRGVHKAPANEVIQGVVELSATVTHQDQAMLNPEGINCIRAFPGQGIRVWGARTLSSDPQWRYVNVRRLFNFVEKSIERSTQWVVFEPNNPDLWARVKRDVTAFLTSVWRTGALFGSSPSEAFQVICDESNNPSEERDQGRLFIDIGLAAVKPAEFVVFRFQQITGGGE